MNFDDLKIIADLSIPLSFNGAQPNAFGADRATAKTLGDTRDGSSVNYEQYIFTPHCNGTHTECVGHITNERLSVLDCLRDVLVPALLISLAPASVDGELMMTRDGLEKACKSFEPNSALIVRTLPNDDSKLTGIYDDKNIPPYFSTGAMTFIVDHGFKHLLVDLPSIDRLHDEGKLTNHRIFWNVEPDSFDVNANTRMNNTITELIYVPNDVADGQYLLNLQIAPFDSDAAPSRPILFQEK